jgi:hypothetical protein
MWFVVKMFCHKLFKQQNNIENKLNTLISTVHNLKYQDTSRNQVINCLPKSSKHRKLHIYVHTESYIYMYTQKATCICTHRMLPIYVHTESYIYMYTQKVTYICTHRKLHIYVHTESYIIHVHVYPHLISTNNICLLHVQCVHIYVTFCVYIYM